MTRVEHVDAAKVEALSHESGNASPWAKYLAALLRGGPLAYVDNAHADMEALLVDGILLPLVVNRGTEESAAICSPCSHYISYTAKEVSRRNPRVPPWLVSATAAAGEHLLRISGIDRVVSVNNWLLSTNPSVRLAADQVEEVTAYLANIYPGRAILWCSLNPVIDQALMEYVRRSRYRLLRSRLVYMVDGSPQVYRNYENARRDLKFLKQTQYNVVSDCQTLAPYAERMAELFRSLYLGRHNQLNPALSSRYFTLALASGAFEVRGFLKDGQLAAFALFYTTDQIMTAALLGYDLNQPRSLGLYRLTMATFLHEATSRGLGLNLSAGADSFKTFRGGVPVDEYEAVYDRHLPISQRTAWSALSVVTRAAGHWRAWGRRP